MFRLSRSASLALLSLALIWTPGCSSAIREDPLLRLSAEEALDEGKKLLEAGKFARAREHFQHAFEVEPNSRGGREALLLVADTLFTQGGKIRMVEAEGKYRDYLTRFPTSDKAAYVQYQIGKSLVAQLGRPDRDQQPTIEAIDAFEELIRLYPTSEHVAEAEQQIVAMRGRLAGHEFEVGYFYLRYGLPIAAVGRFESILEDYPEYSEVDRVLYHLGVAYMRVGKLDEARTTFGRLQGEFPASRWAKDIPEVPASPPAPAPAPTTAAVPEVAT